MEDIILRQREYFQSGITLNVNFRIKMLKKLYKAIKDFEDEITIQEINQKNRLTI